MTATADAGGRWRPNPLGLGLLGDERLARHAGAGDAQAFEIVYERYHAALYRYCRSILHNDPDAQDALQSTFAAAFAALQTGQRDAPMRPWLFRIAHNESISVLRRRRPAFDLSAASERGTASVEDEVAGRAEVSLLLRDLRELTDRQRSALVLRELSGLSHEEIAIALGTSVGGAKQMIFEARQSLFEFAEGRSMACDEIRKTISDADGRSLRARRVRAHLRECAGCAAFAGAIPARTGELHALAPVLPAGAAAGLLGRIALSGVGPPSAHGLARLAAGAAGKSATAAGFGANALAGVAVVASATVGVTMGVDKFMRAVNSGRAGHAGSLAASVSAKGVGPSSSLFGAPFSIVARSATGPAPAATSLVGNAAGARSVVLRPRSTGSLTGGIGLRMAGMGGAGLGPGTTGAANAPSAGTGDAGPSTALSSARVQAGGAAARSGADATSRGGDGRPGSAGAGGGSSRGSSGSGSAGTGKSASKGSGRHGSGGSGHSGSGNSAPVGHDPLVGPGGVEVGANAPGLAGGSAGAVGNAATHTASAVSNVASKITAAGSAPATNPPPTIPAPTLPTPTSGSSSSDPVVLPGVSLPAP